MDKILVTISGAALIGFIYWFFFKASEEEAQVVKRVIVSGGYRPKKIVVPVNTTTNITFLRTDENSCLEEVVIPDLGVKEYLPLNKEITISLTPKKSGTYDIHCGMNMFHGTIIAK